VIPYIQIYSPPLTIGNDLPRPFGNLVAISSWGEFATWEKVRDDAERAAIAHDITASSVASPSSGRTSVGHARRTRRETSGARQRVAKTRRQQIAALRSGSMLPVHAAQRRRD
jgi:hypothetical protein